MDSVELLLLTEDCGPVLAELALLDLEQVLDVHVVKPREIERSPSISLLTAKDMHDSCPTHLHLFLQTLP